MKPLVVTAMLWVLVAVVAPVRAVDLPQTVAEKTDYRATSRYADVIAFVEQLARVSPLVRLDTLGVSHENRKLPLVILADPPVANAEEAARSGKPVVFAMANIHAGEVDGKEALLMLAREIVAGSARPLLRDLVIVFAPIFNADGNEPIARTNRTEQNGPFEGVGRRVNAQGLDLNRDFVKLESPEVRALARFFTRWDPAVVIDCHTTNGSFHRYTLTYEGGRCPAGDSALVAHTRDVILPDVTRRMEKASGYRSYFYGNFSPDRSRWETILPVPRYGTHYVGLRDRVAILSESYSYASFRDRVLASKAFVHAILEHVVANREKITGLLADARRPAKSDDTVALRFEAAPVGRPVSFLGYVEEVKDGRRVRTDTPKTYELQYTGGTRTTLAVPRPFAYLVPPEFKEAVANLGRHGIACEALAKDAELPVKVYRVEKVTREREFQKHQALRLEAEPRAELRTVPAGTVVVRTGQPLGSLAAFLLEPLSEDGLTTWNFFDAGVAEGKDFPVLALPAAAELVTRPLPAPAE